MTQFYTLLSMVRRPSHLVSSSHPPCVAAAFEAEKHRAIGVCLPQARQP